jgi:hypothetical protein
MKVNFNKIYSVSYPDYKMRVENKKDFGELLKSNSIEKKSQSAESVSSNETVNMNTTSGYKYNKTESNSGKINYLGKNIDRRI